MIKIKNKMIKIKHKVNEYFLMKSSIKTLSNTVRMFIFSVGFDEIYNGIKNPKRFKLCIIFCIIMWLCTFWHFLLLVSSSLWLLFDNEFLFDYPKTFMFNIFCAVFFATFLKSDFILGEISGYLDTLKVFHALAVNLSSLHQLTGKNYKQLTILSRITVTILLNYGAPFFATFLPSLLLLITILSKRLYWLIHFIFVEPVYVFVIYTLALSGCICFIYFPYYKMRFDQWNDKIKAIIPNKD